MAQADILTLADALVTELNSHSFSVGFAAVRGYLPTAELPDMGTLRVTVVPKQDDGKLDSRSSSEHQFAIDIGVQQKPATLDNAALDPLMYLVQQIADYFLFGKRPGGMTLINPEVRMLYLPEHLTRFRQFTAVLTLTFKGWRQAA